MTKRVIGLDIIRALAVFFVISVHFFLHSGFYEVPTYGKTLIIAHMVRWLFFTCVPLFLLLTGYLQWKKEPNKKYYKSIIHILLIYIFISIFCLFFRKIYMDDQSSILQLILGIFQFKTCGYSWYINMYIGLFLLIPFLNILYHNLQSKKQKQLLILTLLFLTSVSTLGSGFVINNNSLNLLPDWWKGIYPITYYYLGVYIREYQPSIKTLKNIGLILLFLILQTIISYFSSYGEAFKPYLWNNGGFYYLLCVITSVLVFLLFYKRDIKNKLIVSIITSISILSLDIYLFSYAVDLLIYPFFNLEVGYGHVLMLFFVIVPIIFTISWSLGFIRELIFKLFKKIKTKIKNN